MEFDKNLSFPIIIRLRNKTDEKLYRVPVLTDDLALIDKVQWTCSATPFTKEREEISLEELKNRIADAGENMQIGLMYYMVHGDYPKFVTKQLLQKISINGTSESVGLDPMQYQGNVTIIRKSFNLYEEDKISDITLEYLMPEVEIELRLYPREIKK